MPNPGDGVSSHLYRLSAGPAGMPQQTAGIHQTKGETPVHHESDLPSLQICGGSVHPAVRPCHRGAGRHPDPARRDLLGLRHHRGAALARARRAARAGRAHGLNRHGFRGLVWSVNDPYWLHVSEPGYGRDVVTLRMPRDAGERDAGTFPLSRRAARLLKLPGIDRQPFAAG